MLTRPTDALVEALRAMLDYERVKAECIGFSDCTCMSFSRDSERNYETGRCPHQLARAALAAWRGHGDILTDVPRTPELDAFDRGIGFGVQIERDRAAANSQSPAENP